MYQRDEYESRSVWQSAYLVAMGCPIVRVVPGEPRRSRFVHSNEGNRAFELAAEWRNKEFAMVNGPALVEAYRIVLYRARQAEDEENYYRENSQEGKNSYEQRTA